MGRAEHERTVRFRSARRDPALTVVEGFHALKHALRHIDLFGRYGGEEFLVLLPDTRLAYAWPVAERLRTAVAALAFDDIAPGLAVTVSIGMAQLRAEDAGLRERVARADAALYRAKANGRDRVEAEAS